MYEPRHRAEPVFKYRITVVERERGWGSDWWTEDFDTYEAAASRIQEINSKNVAPVAPDTYIQANIEIERIQL